jgi:hypothetical protein
LFFSVQKHLTHPARKLDQTGLLVSFQGGGFQKHNAKKKAAIRLPFYFHTIIGFPMPLKPVFKNHI